MSLDEPADSQGAIEDFLYSLNLHYKSICCFSPLVFLFCIFFTCIASSLEITCVLWGEGGGRICAA